MITKFFGVTGVKILGNRNEDGNAAV